MDREHTVQVGDSQICQWMISQLRYSFPRDNSAVFSCRMDIEEYLPKLSKDRQLYIAEKLIEEIVGKLRDGSFGQARGHKATYLREHCQVYYEDGTIKDETCPVSTYVSDYEYKEYLADKKGYKPPKYGQDVSKLTVDPAFSWKEEHEWLLLIAFLLDYARFQFHPYNDSDGWVDKAKKAGEDEKVRQTFLKDFRSKPAKGGK
jgi:hypothetical protein